MPRYYDRLRPPIEGFSTAKDLLAQAAPDRLSTVQLGIYTQLPEWMATVFNNVDIFKADAELIVAGTHFSATEVANFISENPIYFLKQFIVTTEQGIKLDESKRHFLKPFFQFCVLPRYNEREWLADQHRTSLIIILSALISAARKPTNLANTDFVAAYNQVRGTSETPRVPLFMRPFEDEEPTESNVPTNEFVEELAPYEDYEVLVQILHATLKNSLFSLSMREYTRRDTSLRRGITAANIEEAYPGSSVEITQREFQLGSFINVDVSKYASIETINSLENNGNSRKAHVAQFCQIHYFVKSLKDRCGSNEALYKNFLMLLAESNAEVLELFLLRIVNYILPYQFGDDIRPAVPGFKIIDVFTNQFDVLSILKDLSQALDSVGRPAVRQVFQPDTQVFNRLLAPFLTENTGMFRPGGRGQRRDVDDAEIASSAEKLDRAFNPEKRNA